MLNRVNTLKKRAGSVPVYLNVYDLTPINGYAYWLGLGVYHSGVEVHGVEYAYGAHDHPASGIFKVEPKLCPRYAFRKSIVIGKTNLNPNDVKALMQKLAKEYTGNTYSLINKNCNHFCDDACIRLTGEPIPRWVNRLAKIGFFCSCVLPVSFNVPDDGDREVEKKKLRSYSNRFASSFDSAGIKNRERHKQPRQHLVVVSA